jgi:hypothetical protein
MNLIAEKVRRANKLTTRTKADRQDEHRGRTNWSVEKAIFKKVNEEDAHLRSFEQKPNIPVPELKYQKPDKISLYNFMRQINL